MSAEVVTPEERAAIALEQIFAILKLMREDARLQHAELLRALRASTPNGTMVYGAGEFPTAQMLVPG